MLTRKGLKPNKASSFKLFLKSRSHALRENKNKTLNNYSVESAFPLKLMAILLFSLRGVPEDEAYEVRELLSKHEINFYETSAGNWGVSMPALWLRDNSELKKARQLLDEYQQQRQLTQRQLYLERKQAGQSKTLFNSCREKPLLFMAYLAVLVAVVYVSIRLLFELGLSL